MSGEPKTQEPNHTVECQHKCRIPQRLPPGRPFKPKSVNVEKNKVDIVSSHQAEDRRFLKISSRPNSIETRPKSANRTHDDGELATARSARPERERLIPPKKLTLPRKTLNEKFYETSLNYSKPGKHIITVPLKQKKTAYHNKVSTDLPDQETIKKCEELELQQEDFSDAADMYNSVNDIFMDLNESESVTSQSDKITQLQNCWQEKIVQFEELKNELNDRQNVILEVYASLRNAKQQLLAIGHKAELPTTDDLRIMNVANMTPNQLLQLCAETKSRKDDKLIQNPLMLDFKKINEIPVKLVTTCEQTLATRKEMIDWFEKLKNQEQGCPKSSLSKKINEFNAENEMLSCTLAKVKNEFINELNDILRTCFNERVALQLRTEEFTCEISELNSQNAELKKQLYNAEKQKSHTNKIRIEELEKELKDEKVKKLRIRDHLSRAEGQVKIEADRAAMLEAAFNQAQARTRSLERTVHLQREQNQQLQKDFATELNKLKESMKKNTNHLEDIATARECLQQEKEDLKKKLEELSSYYNESLSAVKEELNKNIAKVIEVENRYNDEKGDKEKLQKTVESQLARLLQYELRHKDMLKKLQETERTSNELIHYKKEFERTKYELNEALTNTEKCKKLISEQDEKILEIQGNLKISNELENKIKSEISKKDNYISELEERNTLLIQQSRENDCKMQTYEDQLNTLKSHLSKMHEHFIAYENLNEIHESINRQNIKLAETRRKNEELSKELETKQNDLKQIKDMLMEHENLLKQRQSILHTEKEVEQSNILKLNQQINEKNAEITSLITNIKTRKEQISQLEKIILTIEDQNRKCASQKRKDHEKIRALEQKIAEYEYHLSSRNPEVPENLDNLIKILEDELRSPVETQFLTTDSGYCCGKNKSVDNLAYFKQNDLEHQSQHETSYQPNNLLCYDDLVRHNHSKERVSKKMQYIMPKHMKDEKKCKMFKFASHRIP